ncbi:MAG: hypothetical protein ACOCZJ_02210 [Thermoplasmatota archaeon]
MKEFLKRDDDGLILHHWDTDGISATALLLRETSKTFSLFTPIIGNYLLNEKDRAKIDEIDPDYTIVVDMALPEDSIDFLKGFGDVYIFDHHLQDRHDVTLHHNPIIDGSSPKEFPSASWVVNEYLGNESSLLSILGAFGDREEKLKDNEDAYPIIKETLEKLDSDFDSLLKCAYYLDTNYKIGDRDSVSEYAEYLKNIKAPEDILGKEELKENYEKLNKAIEMEVDSDKENLYENIDFLEMESPYNIISTVTRRIAWADEDRIVIVSNCEYMEDDCQIYIRGPLPDSEKIIEHLKGKGYSAGGKSDVIGMVIPKEEKDETLDEVLEMLKI